MDLELKKSKIYVCELCDFVTDKNSKFITHTNTAKHKYNQNTIKPHVPDLKKSKIMTFECECGKSYPYKASLFNHRKKCQAFSEKNNMEITIINKNNENLETNEIKSCASNETNDYLIKIIQDNAEFKKMLIDLIPKIGNNNTQNNTQNNTHNTQNNNKFNINLFLNEQCKDAMSMNEFIDSIEISMQDLLLTKEKGFASGISNIFIKGMSKLSPYQRPIHCTDVKRETLYIKNDKWEKDANKEQIKDAIKSVSAKQFKNIKKYKETNPNCMTNETQRDEYLNIIKNTTETIEGNDTKIIKDICNNVYLNKKVDELADD
jgi:hypothetical protein